MTEPFTKSDALSDTEMPLSPVLFTDASVFEDAGDEISPTHARAVEPLDPDKQTCDEVDHAADRVQVMSEAVRTLLECIGEETNREGLHMTPVRFAKALLFHTQGYGLDLDILVNGAIFHEAYDETVLVKDVDMFSLCEHHLLPFTGKVCLDDK